MTSIGLDNNPQDRYVMYSRDGCPACAQAKMLLEHMSLPFVEYKLGVHYTKETLEAKVPLAFNERLTVPQIFYNGNRIGGFDKLIVYLKENALPN